MRKGWRHDIPVEEAPPIYPLPPKYRVVIKKRALLSMLLRDAIEHRLSLRVVLSRPCIYGVFDGPFGGLRPKHELCVACLRCKQEYPGVVEDIAPDPRFVKLGGGTVDPELIWRINREATTGGDVTRGMGYQGPFAGPGFDSLWTDMSEIVRPTRHGKLDVEYISTKVELGKGPRDFQAGASLGPSHNLVEIAVPILIDACDIPTDRATLNAMAMAAERAKSLLLTRESELVGPRIVNVYEAVDDVGDTPVKEQERPLKIARVYFKDGYLDSLLKAVERGADAVHLVADQRGHGFGGLRDRHMSGLIRGAHLSLVQRGIRDTVSLIVGGGILAAEHVAKSIILGADAVSIDLAALVALQADLSSGKISLRRFPVEWGARRLTNLLNSWREQMIELLSAMGIRDVRRLRGEVGRAMFYEEEERQLMRYISGELDGEGIEP